MQPTLRFVIEEINVKSLKSPDNEVAVIGIMCDSDDNDDEFWRLRLFCARNPNDIGEQIGTIYFDADKYVENKGYDALEVLNT